MTRAHMPKNALGLAISFCGWIWHTRTNWVFNHKKWSLEQICQKTLVDFEEYSLANQITSATSPCHFDVAGVIAMGEAKARSAENESSY